MRNAPRRIGGPMEEPSHRNYIAIQVQSKPEANQSKCNTQLPLSTTPRQFCLSAKGWLPLKTEIEKKNTPNENVTAFSPKIFDDCPLFLPALLY